MPTIGVKLEGLLHLRGERGEAAPHVGDARGEPDAGPNGDRDHGPDSPRISRASASGS